MIRLIVSIIFFIILAVFIAFNAKYTTTVSLYGYVLEEVSTVAVLIVSMALGVLYSFSLYLSSYLAKRRSRKIKKVKNRTQKRAEELKDREKEMESTRAQTGQQPDTEEHNGNADSKSRSKPGPLKRLFGGSRS